MLTLHERFPGAELVFDAFSPFLLRIHNNKVNRTGIGARLHWALKNGRELERWSGPSNSPGAGGTLAPHETQRSAGVRLLDEYFPYRYPEPRIRRFPVVLVLPLLAKALGVFHYQLEEAGRVQNA